MTIFLALQLIYNFLLLLVGGLALKGGGSDEKVAALLMLGCCSATAIVTAIPGFRWRNDHWQVMVIDGVLFVGLGWLASVTKRFWPLWAAAFQTIDIALQAFMLVAPERMMTAFVVIQGFWAYPILLTIWLGTRSHRTTSRSLRNPVQS